MAVWGEDENRRGGDTIKNRSIGRERREEREGEREREKKKRLMLPIKREEENRESR